jgi:hypothetical protein
MNLNDQITQKDAYKDSCTSSWLTTLVNHNCAS